MLLAPVTTTIILVHVSRLMILNLLCLFVFGFLVWSVLFFQIIIFIGSDCKRVPTDYSLTFASADETQEFPWSRICS